MRAPHALRAGRLGVLGAHELLTQDTFIEALAAAGITGGCGTGLYCPDQPVTRGQMAVFLSTALGLHFPN